MLNLPNVDRFSSSYQVVCRARNAPFFEGETDLAVERGTYSSECELVELTTRFFFAFFFAKYRY